MKQKDVALILIVVTVSAVFSLLIAKIFISSPKNRQEKVEVVGEISSVFPEVDKQFFHEQSINPTVIIQIGNDQNTQNPIQ